MKTYEYAGDPFDEPRSHPWLGSAQSPEFQYYDLTLTPARIRSSLEDFLPWSRFQAVESFYALLERLNHPRSALESNDCAFTGPHSNEDMTIPKALQCCGRVMVLFRALERNTLEGSVAWLKNELHVELVEFDPEFQWGVVGTTLIPVRYLALPESDGQQLGTQLMISFWAWGDQEADTMKNLARVIKNLTRALRRVSASASRS
ncbi:MAG: hypothetical protein ABW061_10585 [Polyangiaceae bacterium]